jgi:hypothetical protein
MPTYTLTLHNAGSTISAVIRYPTEETSYPKLPKTYTKYKLKDGSYSYDVPTYATKRQWELDVIREDSGDDLITKLNQLYALNETLYLDEDALISENDIEVYFEDFQPIYNIGNWYDYKVVLQEL